ncbi:MAG TPA: hypothetical protein VGO73_11515 [Pyrinomonadaceae bacterium]|jgi:hypothetical protein|nr:hypothetical protein [Pyrinomonadaceae bacterium]
MKKLITLATVLALVALGSISWAAANLNSQKSGAYRLAFENKLGRSTQPIAAVPQTIKICKQTIPSGGTGFPFAWANGFGSLPPFSLNDGQCETKDLTGQDHYNKFTENVPAGWTLTNINCSYTTSPVKIIGANSNPAFQPGDNTVTMDVNETNVTCMFTNQRSRCCSYQLDLSTGQASPIDPQWKVNGNPAYTTPKVGSWMMLGSGKWIQPTSAPLPDPQVNQTTTNPFKYTVKFAVPDCPAGPVRLIGTFAADNSAVAYLDNNPIPNASCSGPVCFNTTSGQAPVSLNGAPPIGPGPHTLEIRVNNLTKSYSGLIVNAKVTRQCP